MVKYLLIMHAIVYIMQVNFYYVPIRNAIKIAHANDINYRKFNDVYLYL